MSAIIDDSPIAKATLKKITWRLLPILMLAYFISYVDRVNVGFAALQMNQDIGLTAAVFGFGSGLFYLTYVLFEIPSNLALEKIGTRWWIARIMITWGLVAAGMAFVVGPNSFYVMRLLMGAAEAGFFPGVVLYLTYWFPAAYRAKIIAIFMVAIPLSSFFGSPLSAMLLQLDGLFGLKGWQVMFILEGLPAVLLGLMIPWLLTDNPSVAKWLTTEEKEWLTRTMAIEAQQTVPKVKSPSIKEILLNKYMLAAGVIYAGATAASQMLSLWQPQIIKSFGLTTMQTGLLNSIPFGIASLLMLWWGAHSDKTQERVWHSGIPLFLIAMSLALVSVVGGSLTLTILLLIVAVSSTYIFKGPFWALASEWMGKSSAAVGLAQVNAIGNLAGFAGSWLLGIIKESTGSFALALLPVAAIAGLGCIILFIMSKKNDNV